MRVILISSKEKMSGLILLQNEGCNVVVMLEISVKLEELGVNFNTHFKVAETKGHQRKCRF